MKDLLITINANTRNANFSRNFIGVNGEYLDGYIKIDFEDEFIDGIATFEFERSDGKYYIEMTKGDDDYYYLQIKSSLLSKAEKLKCQIRIDQAGEEIFKCRRFPLYVLTAVNSATTIPEDYGDWLSHANQKLFEIDEAIDDAEEATANANTATQNANTATERANTISADLENKRDTDYYRGAKGDTGDTGNGIASIIKTGTSGLVDTYTVTMTNGETATFTVTNGAKGDTGNGIQSITKTSTAGLVDTYTVLFTDSTTTTFTITNGAKGDKGDTGDTGNGIQSITKTSTSGLVDTYTITFTNGTTTTFTVTNGADGTKIYINNVEQASLHFDSDPQTQINNKLDKSNDMAVLYGTNLQRQQTTVLYGTSVLANFIPQRTAGSQILVPTTPTADNNAASKKYVDDGLASKQNTLTFDDTPTANSNNPVKSGGVYAALPHLYEHTIYIIESDWRIFVTILNNSSTQFTQSTFTQWLYNKGFNTSDIATAKWHLASGGYRSSNYSICGISAPTSSTLQKIFVANSGTTSGTITVASFSDKVTQIF